jgi:beta-barrel assembly-enhancing protease
MTKAIHALDRIFFGATVLLLIALPARADNKEKDPDEIGNRDVGKGVNFYSIEKEIALGKQMAQEVERQARIVDDPVVSEYVNRIGQNLVRNSDAKVPFTIKVIDSEEINAFALPGGFFFVNTGILLNADNEAEMAGVMAHEIGHVAARHGTRQATRGQIARIASIVPLVAVGGMAGYGIYQAMGLVVPLGFLQFSRAMESEADMLGIEYMYKAGYDPGAFVDFFEKVQSQEKRKPGTMSKLFSSHPPTDDRIKRSQEVIQKYLKAKPEYVVSTSEFESVKARTMAMHNSRKIDNTKDSGRPALRRNPNGQIDSNGDEKAPQGDQGDRPTLKRRDD